MEITKKLLFELQNRLKVGSRRGVHLNAIPARSRYKFDLTRLSHIDEDLPQNFINALLSEQPLKFKVSWKDNVPDLNSLFEDDQVQLVRITKSFENLINQTDAIESEKGINTFGFGFPLLVRRDQSDKKLTVAPILIWSLKIKRTKEFNTWVILRDEHDPVYINEVLINHLQSDSRIEIESISPELLDDGLIDKEELIDICANLIETINSTSPDDDLRCTFKQKLENIKPISDKKHYEKLPLTSNNSFIDFGGLFSIFEVQKQNIIHDYANLLDLEGTTIDLEDMDEHSFQPISSVETDPSQQSILHSLKNTRNILIQGPPGTGKSQSLTAILINALENHKKTIVVCEKITALNVLKKALDKRGLSILNVQITEVQKSGRRNVVYSVRDRIENTQYHKYRYTHSKETLDNIIDKAKSLIDSINKKHLKLGEKLIGNKNWTHIVGEYLSQLKGNEEEYKLNVEKGTFKYDSTELNDFLELIRKGHNLYNDFKPNKDTSFLNSSKLLGDNPYLIEQQLKDDFSNYKSELEIVERQIKVYHTKYFVIREKEIKDKIEEIKYLVSEIEKLHNNIPIEIENIHNNYFDIREKDFSKQLRIIEKDINLIKSIYKKYSSDIIFLTKKDINSLPFKLKSFFSKRLKKLKKESELVESKIIEIETSLYECIDIKNVEFGNDLQDKKQNFYTFIDTLTKTKNNFKNSINIEFNALKINGFSDEKINHQECLGILRSKNESSASDLHKEFFKETLKNLSKTQDKILIKHKCLSSVLENSNDFKTIEFNDTLISRLTQILQDFKNIESSIKEHEFKIQSEIELIDILKKTEVRYQTDCLKRAVGSLKKIKERINADGWTTNRLNGKSQKKLINSIQEIIQKKEDYFSNDNDLFPPEFKWFQYYNSLLKQNRIIIDQLLEKVEWEKVFLIYYLNSMLVNSANINLPTDDKDHQELTNSLADIEDEQLKYICEYWFSKQIDTTREFDVRNQNLSVENLYNKRKSNNHQRLSLRQIVKYDLDLFTTFFPIILTTPDVCSNLFKSENQYFDIVMFDEASQLKLEDNLPALLKGKQIIIAGDEHQMPPSNYFSKIFDGLIDDEDDFEEEDEIKVDRDNILLSCESLLDFASELDFEKKHLDFHYRSRHPYLIDFSNYAFYNKRLKPLPNSFEYNPIKYIQVNGTYSDHTNEVEAETILSIIENNINRLPNGEYPSVGIATFNIHQRNLILSKINERRKFDNYTEFNEKILELEENGLFVKNLENIQGDERDVIILTTTYGINKDGKFAHRFGSINHQKGYKLLNVIITRARYKIYVCSSIPEEVFLNYKEYLSAEGSNNRRAVFFAYLAYCKSVSDNDTEQRLAILNTLSDNTTKSSTFGILNEDLESPFEEEVYQALTEHFDEAKIIPQLQFAGFRIDLVYDSKISGVPKIAIECDGAAYHSSQEAYLYDRHRQKILEGHGFIFHRIWSTNWWRNPKRETKILVKFIQSIENSNHSAFEDKSNKSFAFTDNIKIIENEPVKVATISQKNLEEAVEAVSKKEKIQTELFKETIDVNNKVKIKYLNIDKDLRVHLVEQLVSKTEKSNGIQKINIKSPLGVALKGKSVGETVKIGDLDKYVKVLEIMN